MERAEALRILRAHEPELRAAGIVHLFIFGSVARDEASENSDVDLLAEFDDRKKITLLDMVGLENKLTDILRVRVDLAPAKSVKGHIRQRAASEAILAF